MLIAFLLYLFALLALWHFVIEGIIGPSTRATIRLRLFALRDELRRLRLNGAATDDEFEEAQRVINNIIRLAPSIDGYMLVQWEMKLKSDKELAERVERRRLNFESTASEKVKQLVQNAYTIAGEAIRVNSMGWVVYLVPLIIGVAIWKRISREVTNMTSATEHEWSSGETCPA